MTVKDDAEHEPKRLKEDVERHAELLKEQAERDAEQLVQRDSCRTRICNRSGSGRDDLIYGGLMGIGIVMIQPFLTATSLDTAATIGVVAIAIPLLAALILVNRRETFRRRTTSSRIVEVARAVAQFSASRDSDPPLRVGDAGRSEVVA